MKKPLRIIFTRHTFTAAQVAAYDGLNAAVTDAAARLTLHTDEDARKVVRGWLNLAAQGEADCIEVFGVFPAILRGVLYPHSVTDWDGRMIDIFESHNINRAAEGEKPVFEFNGWYRTGRYWVRSI